MHVVPLKIWSEKTRDGESGTINMRMADGDDLQSLILSFGKLGSPGCTCDKVYACQLCKDVKGAPKEHKKIDRSS